MSETVLTVNNLTKHYGLVKALNGLSLEVESGSVFGLLGPNGSGKTTTLGILLGILNATDGDFSWFGNGQDFQNRLRIGAILEQPNFYPYLSAKQNLKVTGLIRNVENMDQRIDEVLDRVNLSERAMDKFKTYSLGMKQRLAIASALLNDPEVLVLDEPTNGLDPEGIAEIRELIGDIAREGKTILIASHILDEIEKVCTHVAIMRKGEMLSYGPLHEIMGGQMSVVVAAEDKAALKAKLQTLDWVTIQQDDGNTVSISLADGRSTAELNKWLFENGIVLTELRSQQRKLESIFLETVKQ